MNVNHSAVQNNKLNTKTWNMHLQDESTYTRLKIMTFYWKTANAVKWKETFTDKWVSNENLLTVSALMFKAMIWNSSLSTDLCWSPNCNILSNKAITSEKKWIRYKKWKPAKLFPRNKLYISHMQHLLWTIFILHTHQGPDASAAAMTNYQYVANLLQCQYFSAQVPGRTKNKPKKMYH